MATPARPLEATPDHGGVSRRLAWVTVGFLWFAYLLNYIDRQAVFSIFPALRSDLGFSNTQLGLVGTVFLWSYSLCMPLAGRLGDLVRRDRLVISSLVLWSLATLGTSLSASVAALLFWRAMMGITESLYVPNALATVAVLHAGPSRSKALAVHNSAQFAGIMGGGWYGGWAADHFGWRPGFAVLAIAGGAYALVLWAVFRGMRHFGDRRAHQAGKPADIFKSPCYWALGLAFFAFCTMLWMLWRLVPEFHLRALPPVDDGEQPHCHGLASGQLHDGSLGGWCVRRLASQADSIRAVFGRDFRSGGKHTIRFSESGGGIVDDCEAVSRTLRLLRRCVCL